MKKYQFGYGCMRLPTLQKDDPASFDYEKIDALFDSFAFDEVLNEARLDDRTAMMPHLAYLLGCQGVAA